jgi:membrane dipeptidase
MGRKDLPELIVDAHNDLPFELVYRRQEANPFATHWLPKLERGGVRLVVCALSAETEDLPESALRRTLEQVTACHRAIRENSDYVSFVRSARDLDAVKTGERIGLVLCVEGGEPFGYDPEMADVFWELGVRVFGLTWNRRNAFGDGLGEPPGGGLTHRGMALVDQLTQRGAIIDLAHASERTFFEVLERVEDGTVILSHAGCRSIVDSPRNASDEQLEALAGHGGVLGIMALPFVIDPSNPTIARMIDHFDHAVELMGIEHVGIGGDFQRQIALSGAFRTPPSQVNVETLLPPGMTLDASLKNLAGPEDYPALVQALTERGYAGERLERILGGNFVRVFERTLPGDEGTS